MYVSHVRHSGNSAMSQTCKQLPVGTELANDFQVEAAFQSYKMYTTKSPELSVALCATGASFSKSLYCQFTNFSEMNSFILLILLQFFNFFTEFN